MKILVVDDSKSVHAFVEVCLQGKGHSLVRAYNGREALAVLSQGAGPFDLILLDWEMPEMTGPELLKNLRSNGSQVPVIMMTTRNSSEDISSMLAAGATEYVMKPFKQDILLEKIAAVMEGMPSYAA